MAGTQYSDLVPIVSAAGLATNSAADIATLTVPFKCEVRRAFVLVTGTSAHATAFVIKFDRRQTAGSDGADRGDGDVATISKTASTNQQGKFLYEDPSTRVTLAEGDEVVAQVTTANGDACTATVGILVERIPESVGNNSDMVSA